MDELQRNVLTFHKTFGIRYREKPTTLPFDRIQLRIKLIREELQELRDALYHGDITDIADGLGDLLYVVYGTAVECGIDMEEINQEIHRSNMTKVGGHMREDGKWIKPKSYDPPHLIAILSKQKEVVR